MVGEAEIDIDEEEKEKDPISKEDEGETFSDPVIVDAFSSMKSAILSKRTDIVRQIICAAESIREDDYESDDESELNRKVIRDKYDSEEYIDMLSLLLRHQDTDSGTLLHIATRVDTADIVRTLLAAGSNCLVENHEKKTAYQYCTSDLVRSAYTGELLQAVSQSRFYRVDHLLNAGIDVNSCDSSMSYNSVLHWAVCYGDLNIVSLIIQKGGLVNACNVQGTTPLHEAIKRGHHGIIEELLKCGASLNIRAVAGPFEGLSPKDLCKDFSQITLMMNGCILNGIDSDVGTEFIVDCNDNITYNCNVTPPVSTMIQPSTCPVTVPVDPLVNILCPPAQSVKQFKGLYFVAPQKLTVYFQSTGEDILPMYDIVELFIGKFRKIGIEFTYEYLAPGDNVTTKTAHMLCVLNKDHFSRNEEYKIQVNTHRLLVLSSCPKSFFYGMSTIIQILKLFKGKGIPLLEICDWPRFCRRSVVLDFKENSLPKINILLEIMDLLAMCKINEVQFNVEHFSYKNKVNTYSKNECFIIQTYCKKRFITLVPYIHLHTNCSLLDQGVDLAKASLCIEKVKEKVNFFPFSKTIHLEMEYSRNEIIHQLYEYCDKSGYTLQLSPNGTSIDKSELQLLSDKVVFTLTGDQIAYYNELGLHHIVSYNCEYTNRIYPTIGKIMKNTLSAFVESSSTYGAAVKFSFKHPKLPSLLTFIPSLVLPACMLWNLTTAMTDEDLILNMINYLIYEDDNDHIGQLLVGIADSLPMITKVGAEEHPVYEEENLFDLLLSGTSVDISLWEESSFHKICKTVKTHKQNLLEAKINSSLRQPFVQECNLLLKLMIFLSRVAFKLLDLKSKTNKTNLDDLPDMNKSDEANRLMSLIEEYNYFCAEYYMPSNVSLGPLHDLLQKIIPRRVKPASCSIEGAIDI